VEFAELKYSFLKKIVERGYQTIEEIPKEITEGIPVRLVEKWVTQFTSIPPLTALPQNPRLVNRFMIGADPEFTFMDQGRQYAAMKIGLQTGMAFGQDMNGRLAELRPVPSRFALDVVASILAELRWMAMYFPFTLKCQWLSTPYDGQDGVGGHVHFARRRNKLVRDEDISHLARLYACFTKTRIFSNANEVRTATTKYGSKNDYRLQKHGYEYRGFPTWLDSPLLAYIVLVLSKLSLYDQRLIDGIYNTSFLNIRNLERSLMNMLAFYKNVDDDAWIAYHAIKRWGLPKQHGMDFRANWGIVYGAVSPKLGGYYPPMIEGGENEKQAIFNYLVNKIEIKPDLPTCTWEPSNLPKGYHWLMNSIKTYHKVGLGEIVNDLVHCDKAPMKVDSMDHDNVMLIDRGKWNCEEGIKLLAQLNPRVATDNKIAGLDQLSIFLPACLRTNDMIPKVKEVLTSGLFPVWNIKDVKENSYDEWVSRRSKQVERKLIGKELVI